jgi:hypothetical protein
MNHILAICNNLSAVELDGMNVFLRALLQAVTMERFNSIHIFDVLPFFVTILLPVPISRKDSTKVR